MGTGFNEKEELRGESNCTVSPLLQLGWWPEVICRLANSFLCSHIGISINTAFSPLQNILKKVEEKSDRESTALDAHKELETVSLDKLTEDH